MKTFFYMTLALLVLCAPASGATVLFDFNSGPQFTPLPLDLTVGGISRTLQRLAKDSQFKIRPK